MEGKNECLPAADLFLRFIVSCDIFQCVFDLLNVFENAGTVPAIIYDTEQISHLSLTTR